MIARSHVDLHNVRHNIERVKKLSDNIIGIGPIGIGLDGLLTWIPFAGAIYSGIAGVMLVGEGIRARAAPTVLVQMGAILLVDTVVGEVPVAGNVADMLFTGHKWSANMLLKHMDETIYVEGTRAEAKGKREYADLLECIRTGKEKRRIVFLG
ncbi:MAG: DUF4112 domain-containing protein [Caulobacteraceae bacterium]